jgi:hypothetical protein
MRNDRARHQRISLVADHDSPRIGDRLQSRCEISLRTDYRIVHPLSAAKIPNIAKAGVNTHPNLERKFNSLIAPPGVKLRNAALHVQCHPHTRDCVLHVTIAFWVSEKNQHRITGELGDGSRRSEARVRHLHCLEL